MWSADLKVQQHILPFKIDFVARDSRATAHAGLPLVLEALRAVVGKSSWRRLAKAVGLKGWRTARRHVESLVLLLSDGQCWRHFAVVTNMQWEGERLLRWHREKQGTVEHAHGMMKNELAGGTLPCGRFGAHAAGWRLNVLVANLLQFLKIRALPAEMALLRPKALRFRLLNLPGIVVRHARQVLLRFSEHHPVLGFYAAAREALATLLRPPAEEPMPGT